jgi:hypothetical protein
MKPKKRPTKNGIYAYCPEGNQGQMQILHFRDGKYAHFAQFMDNPEYSYPIEELINNGATWLFYGPLNLADSAA